jgi:hypothetical protein
MVRWHLQCEVRGGDIVVTLAGTSYRITYHKPQGSRQLVAKRLPLSDSTVLLSHGDFLAQAWKLANDKARELGWIA